MSNFPQLTDEQKATIDVHIDREMGERATKVIPAYVVLIVVLLLLSNQARAILPIGYIPVAIFIAAVIARYFSGLKLMTAPAVDLPVYRKLYLIALLANSLSWSCIVAMFILEDASSTVTTIGIFSATVITAGGMSTLTQRVNVWRWFQVSLWTPISIALFIAAPGMEDEIWILALFVVIAAILSTIVGSGVCHQYMQTFIANYNREKQSQELAQAKQQLEQQQLEVTRHRDYLEEMVEAQTTELLMAIRDAESANASQSMFLSNMSHELRTPMHAILSFASFGIKKIDQNQPEKLKVYFQKIHENGNRLMHLLNDLLELAKLEAKHEPTLFTSGNILDTVRSCVSARTPNQTNKRIEIDAYPSESDCTGEFDAQQISQVLDNILANALRFTEEGSTINVTVSSIDEKTSKLGKPALNVTVKDHGVGLPEGEEELVFDRFVQSSKTSTGAGGTGLGLAICKKIIEAHSGIIWASNNSDGGACFEFQIPKQHSV